MTATNYFPIVIYDYFLTKDVAFQFSTLLLLDIARQKILSKSSRKLKIEILLVESKKRPEYGFQQPLRQDVFGSALWRIIIYFSSTSGIIFIRFQSVKSLKMANILFLKIYSHTH